MKYLILLIILVGVIFIVFNLRENFDTSGSIALFTQKSNEAIQNIAQIYADASGTVVFNNVNAIGMINGNLTGNVNGNVTGNLIGDVSGNVTGNVKGNIDGSITSPNNNYKLSIDNSGNLLLFDSSVNKNINIKGNYGGYMYSSDGLYRIRIGNINETGIIHGEQYSDSTRQFAAARHI
jgi:hypothetical protein